MTQGQLTGSRIRERRIDLGLRQADLAERAGISGSYLNLIEHNRRRIAGRLLNDIARLLDIDAALLTGTTETTQVGQLRNVAAEHPAAGAEVRRAEEFAGRFPGWSRVILSQATRIEALESRVSALTDRLAHDPQLANSLHEVLSAATAIRSTASILAGGDPIDADWQARFHRNIHDDSQRLAESSRRLVAFLDNSSDQNATGPLSPVDEVEAWLAARSYHVAELEDGGSAADVVDAAPMSGPLRALLRPLLDRYAEDAARLPLEAFVTAAEDADYDPALLCDRTGAPPEVVLRRLATLPSGSHPDLGLAICDASGALTLLKPVEGVEIPRGGGACPLWPIFAALSQQGRAIRTVVALPGEPARRFLCHAIAYQKAPPRFNKPPATEAVMLLRPWSQATNAPPEPVGIGCRICPRGDCASRREPSLVGGAGAAA